MSVTDEGASAPAGFELSDRSALITGGAGGIGLAVARRFVRAGARVALADIRNDAAQQAAATLRQEGYAAIGLAGDVSRQSDAETLVAATVKEFGRIDILVNNAGFMGRVAPMKGRK